MKRLTKHKFGFDMSALSEYVNETRLPLLTKSLFDNNTAMYLNQMTGVKHKENLNIVDDEIYYQDGSVCGFNASGDTKFTKREMHVGKIKVEKSWCISDLENFWSQIVLPAGSTYKDLPLEQVLVNHLMGLLAERNEVAIWQSQRGLVDGNLNKFDGLRRIISVAGSAVEDANDAAFGTPLTAITAANALSATDRMVAALPANLKSKPDLALFMGWDFFQKLLLNLRTVNNFFIDGADSAPYRTGILNHPTWGIPIVAVHGLNGLNEAYMMRGNNGWLGTDLRGEEDDIELWYEQKDDAILSRVKFKMGTQIAFPNEVVKLVI
jgi:hypothetical protein